MHRMRKKTKFVKKRAGDGCFLNTLVNKLPFETHLPGHNFTGAGTQLYKRLNSDETSNEWSIPKIDLTTQLSITIYDIQHMMIPKLRMRFVIRQCLMS